MIKFPLWNFLLDDKFKHYIVGSSVICANVLNMNPTMNCSYNLNTRELTVEKPVTALTQMKQLVFRIS